MKSKKKWVAYLVRCSDNSLYCGISNDLKIRLLDHNSGKGAKYTRTRRPVKLVGISSELTKSEALKLEYKIKQLPVARKIAELTRKEEERTIEQGLKALLKEFKTLGKKVEKLTKAVEKALTC
jgi:putative endonuclease